MPTENRSSNTEMVSVPRALIERLEQFGEGSTPGRTVRKDALEQLYAVLTQSATQPHPDPIAWMVGTAFWWTKVEAERDSAATGLPIVGLGPMAGVAPAEQHQGQPVQAFKNCIDARAYIADLFKQRLRRHDFDQYITERLAGDFAFALANWLVVQGHADPAEVERLLAANSEYARRHIEQIGEGERLRAALSFYADREHYHFESGNWDTVSGEPQNILWCGDEPDFIEDGTVARNALSASAVPQVKS